MPKEPTPTLGDLVTELALSAIEVQRRLDSAAKQRPGRFRDQAMRVREFRMETGVALSVGKGSEFSLSARPINLSYRLLQRSTVSTESRISFTIGRADV